MAEPLTHSDPTVDLSIFRESHARTELLRHLSAALCLTFAFSVSNCANSYAVAGPSTRAIGAGQESPRQLAASESVEREIKGGEVYLFSVSLAANQFVRLVVQRNGIDLFVNVIAPGGSVTKHENPAGARSPIFVLIRAEVSGTYRVEIRPTRKWLAAGRYEIRREEVLSPTASDEKHLLAQQIVVAARRQLLDSADSQPAARTKYAEAIELWREVGDTYQEANTLHFIAQTYKALGDFEKAEEYYKRTLDRRGDDREARAYTLLDLAEVYYTIKGPLASLSHYEEALAAFRESQNRRGLALTLSQLGLIHMRQYDWEGARKILQEALDIDRSEGDMYEETRVLNALGGVSDNQGQPEKAMELYEKAREGFHQMGDSAREGNMYINIGLHYDTWGEWREASNSYYRAIDLFAAGEAAGEGDRSFINSKRASVFYNIGSLYVSLGDYITGLAYLQRSLELRPPNEQGATLMWFGYTHVLSGEPRKALEYCERAIKLQEQTSDPRRAQSYTVTGMAHDALGMHEKAVEFFNRALEIQQNEKTLDLKGQAITFDKRGRALAALGEVASARKDLETALTHWRTFKDRNGEALTLFHLAGIERDGGNLDSALASAEAATRLIEPLRANVIGQQLRASYFASKVDYYGLYIDLKMQSRPANDVARTTAAFEASERERARGLLDMISDTNLEGHGLTDPALAALVEKRRVMQRSIHIKSAQQSESLVKRSNAKLSVLDGDLVKLGAELDRVDAQLTSQYPRFAALVKPEPLNAKEIQHQLDDDTLLLEYSLGETRSYVWAVSMDSIKGFEMPGREEIENTALRLTKSLTERNRNVENETPQQWRRRLVQADAEYTEASSALSRMVIEPVAALLGNKRLVIVADGALQIVSFGALPGSKRAGAGEPTPPKAKASGSNSVTDDRRPLIDDHEIVYQASASVLAFQRRELENRKPAPLAVAVLADPVFNQGDSRVRDAGRSGNSRGPSAAQKQQEGAGLPGPSATNSTQPSDLTRALRDVGLGQVSWLPYSRDEAEAIIKFAPRGKGMAALGFKASRSTAMSSELSKYRIVHFATHGVVDFEHPELSGIILSMVDEKGQSQDGYLRLHDIYNLNLPAELVVLSACQTGVGKQIKGEGLIALTRGFMYAGAARVVASLWKVDDAATAELMAEFYKQMFTNGLKPAAALREAQRELAKQKRWRSPYYWAGFVLQGEWK